MQVSILFCAHSTSIARWSDDGLREWPLLFRLVFGDCLFRLEVTRARLQSCLKWTCSNRLPLSLYKFKKNGPHANISHPETNLKKKNCCNMLADSLPSQSLQTFLDWLLQRTLECVEGSVWLYHKLNLYCLKSPFLLLFFFFASMVYPHPPSLPLHSPPFSNHPWWYTPLL